MSLGDLTCFYPFFLIQKTEKIMFCLTSTSSRDDKNDLELRGQRVCVGRESRMTTNFIMIIATFFPPLSCSHYCFQALTLPKAGFNNGIYFLWLLISSAWRILACYDGWLLFPTWKNLTACRLKRPFLIDYCLRPGSSVWWKPDDGGQGAWVGISVLFFIGYLHDANKLPSLISNFLTCKIIASLTLVLNFFVHIIQTMTNAY